MIVKEQHFNTCSKELVIFLKERKGLNPLNAERQFIGTVAASLGCSTPIIWQRTQSRHVLYANYVGKHSKKPLAVRH